MNDRYLLDREGPPDPFVQRIERTLATKRYRATSWSSKAIRIACAAVLVIGPAWLAKLAVQSDPGRAISPAATPPSAMSPPRESSEPRPASFPMPRSIEGAVAEVEPEREPDEERVERAADRSIEAETTPDPIVGDVAVKTE